MQKRNRAILKKHEHAKTPTFVSHMLVGETGGVKHRIQSPDESKAPNRVVMHFSFTFAGKCLRTRQCAEEPSQGDEDGRGTKP